MWQERCQQTWHREQSCLFIYDCLSSCDYLFFGLLPVDNACCFFLSHVYIRNLSQQRRPLIKKMVGQEEWSERVEERQPWWLPFCSHLVIFFSVSWVSLSLISLFVFLTVCLLLHLFVGFFEQNRDINFIPCFASWSLDLLALPSSCSSQSWRQSVLEQHGRKSCFSLEMKKWKRRHQRPSKR
jgi:hypothetical protein